MSVNSTVVMVNCVNRRGGIVPGAPEVLTMSGTIA